MAAAKTAVARAKIDLPTDINAEMAAEMEAMKNRVQAPTGDRIQVTQSKTFKLATGDEVKEFDCVIVDFVAANMLYEEAYDRNNITPPICYAVGLEPSSLAPVKESPQPQSDKCATCDSNQFGSAGKGKACQNTRMLGVLPIDADVSTPLSVLKVSPTAIAAFDSYVGLVARTYNVPVRAVITRVAFNPNKEYASLVFSVTGPADKDLLLLAHARKAEALDRLQQTPSFVVAEPVSKKPAKRAPAVRR